MKLTTERWFPIVTAMACCFLWIFSSVEISNWPHPIFSLSKTMFPADKTSILSASLTLGAILSGFLATSQSILLSLSGGIKKELNSSGYIDNLTLYLTEGILFSFSFAIISLVGFFICNYLIQLIWLFLAFSSVLAFWRVTYITLKILKYKEG